MKLSHGIALPDIIVHKEIDSQTGDLILHNYGDYVDTLDGLLQTNLQRCQEKTPEEIRYRDATTKQYDWYQTFRTLTLFLWITLNSALVMIVVNIPKVSMFRPTASGGEGLLYIGIVLWAYAGVTGFQYWCTILYALNKLWTWIATRLKSSRMEQMSEGHEEV